jgi:hypothetical protein
MNKLNIITPCYDTRDLPFIINSFDEGTLINWYIIYDKKVSKSAKIINGNSNLNIFQLFCSTENNKNDLFNFGLDLVKDGFVYFLDDDCTMHPDFWNWFNHFDKRKIYTFLNKNIDSNCLVVRESGDGLWYICESKNSNRIVSQSFENSLDATLSAPQFVKGKSFEGFLNPCYLGQGKIDYSMCCFDSKFLNGERLDNESDNAYSEFISKIYLRNSKSLRYIDREISSLN